VGPLVGVKRPFGGLILGGPKPAGKVDGADNGALRMRSRGFTLIELLVALAIMAVVSAIAVPIYTQYSIRTQRTNAEKDLLMCAQSMERLASTNFTYAGQVGGADTGVVTPNICTPSTTMYSIAVTAANANTFTIRATPTSGPVFNPNDGNLEVDANGAQRWDRNHDGDFGDAYETSWTH
jgi:type IV pilus assembly protein PilE